MSLWLVLYTNLNKSISKAIDFFINSTKSTMLRLITSLEIAFFIDVWIQNWTDIKFQDYDEALFSLAWSAEVLHGQVCYSMSDLTMVPSTQKDADLNSATECTHTKWLTAHI